MICSWYNYSEFDSIQGSGMNSTKRVALTSASEVFSHLGLYPQGQTKYGKLSLAAPKDKSFLAVYIPRTLESVDFMDSVDSAILHKERGVTTVLIVASRINYYSWRQAEDWGKQGHKFVLASTRTISRIDPLMLCNEANLAIFPQKVGTTSALSQYIRQLRYNPSLSHLRKMALSEHNLHPISLCFHMSWLLRRAAKVEWADKWPSVLDWGALFDSEFTPKQLEYLSDALLRGGLTLEEFCKKYRYFTTNDVEET